MGLDPAQDESSGAGSEGCALDELPAVVGDGIEGGALVPGAHPPEDALRFLERCAPVARQARWPPRDSPWPPPRGLRPVHGHKMGGAQTVKCLHHRLDVDALEELDACLCQGDLLSWRSWRPARWGGGGASRSLSSRSSLVPASLAVRG